MCCRWAENWEASAGKLFHKAAAAEGKTGPTGCVKLTGLVFVLVAVAMFLMLTFAPEAAVAKPEV